MLALCRGHRAHDETVTNSFLVQEPRRAQLRPPAPRVTWLARRRHLSPSELGDQGEQAAAKWTPAALVDHAVEDAGEGELDIAGLRRDELRP